MEEMIRYWLALKAIKGVGPATVKSLLRHFKTPEKIFDSSLKSLLDVKGVTPDIAKSIQDFKDWGNIDKEICKAGSCGISIRSWEDTFFPTNLLNIYDPPPVIYAAGELDNRDAAAALAVVGARNASSYGLEIAGNFCYRLAKTGVTIVSGLARGIDTAAHRGALAAGGRTIAVMGCGIDITYPAENAGLRRKIEKSGAVIAEFPLGTPPDRVNFPKRNRLISGLSQAVLVVEASEKSGSLITARYALEQGREVYAIPGQINSQKSRGVNSLIKEGAKLVDKPEDILTDLNPSGKIPSPRVNSLHFTTPLNAKENKVFSCLGSKPVCIDQLIDKSLMSVSDISAVLLQLELMGVVKRHPGNFFTKTIL